MQASTRVEVHTRRLTPTHAQETEPEEEHSDESDVGRTAKWKRKKASGGADTGEEKHTRSRHTRRGPKPADAPPRKGEASAKGTWCPQSRGLCRLPRKFIRRLTGLNGSVDVDSEC